MMMMIFDDDDNTYLVSLPAYTKVPAVSAGLCFLSLYILFDNCAFSLFFRVFFSRVNK